MPTYTFNINSDKKPVNNSFDEDNEDDFNGSRLPGPSAKSAIKSALPAGKKKRTAAQQAALKKMLNANKGN